MAHVHYAGLRSPETAAELGRWSIPGQIDWREWDGDMVVRVHATAQTVLLSPLAGEVLKAMRSGAGYVDEIAARVFAECVPPSAATAALVAAFSDVDADTASLLAILAELESIGLARADLT